MAALRLEESLSTGRVNEKTHSGKGEKNSRGGRCGEKMVETDTSAEVRDEKGKILFSFHVIKYLL